MQSHSESESESSNDQMEELRTLSIETQNSGYVFFFSFLFFSFLCSFYFHIFCRTSSPSLIKLLAFSAPTAFANASDFTMYNPSFVIHHSNTHNVAYCRKKPKLSRGINK